VQKRTALFLPAHRYCYFAPLLPLHTPGPSHSGAILLNVVSTQFGKRRHMIKYPLGLIKNKAGDRPCLTCENGPDPN